MMDTLSPDPGPTPGGAPLTAAAPHSLDGIDEAAARQSALAEARLARTIADFPRLLQGRFRRHDPKDADRPPLARAARLAGTYLGLKTLSEVEPAEHEAAEAYLERFAAASGARIRGVHLDSPAALEGEGPVIGTAIDGRPLLLLPRRLRGMRLLDPVANQSVPWSQLALDRIGFALHPVLPATRLSYRSLLGFGLGGCATALLVVLGLGAVESLLELALPTAFAFVAGRVIPTDDVMLLVEVCGVLLAAMLLQTGLRLTSQRARAQVEGRAGLVLHAAMVDRVLRLPTAVLRQSSTAILATQTETVDKFRRSVINHVITMVLATMNGVTAAALMCFYAPVAGLVGIASVVFLLAVTALFGRLQFKAIYAGERMDVVVLTFVYDLIRLVPLLQAHRAERAAFVHWAQNFLAFQSRIMRSTRMSNMLQTFEGGWEILTLGLTFAAVAMVGGATGGRLGMVEVLSTGAAVAFVISLGKLNAAGLESAHALAEIAKVLPMAKLARSLLDQTILPQVSGAPVPPLRGEISMIGVSFSYDARVVLSRVDVEIPAGAFIGICGPSGGGKTTLLRLLLGLDQPQSGRVLIDGLDASALDRAALANQVGVVLENGQLWAGSILENIRGQTEIGIAEATALADQVGLGPDLAAMPMGLQTIVGASGLGLSRGQIQRVLIARALAVRPRIFVLDEPAGALRGAARADMVRILAELDMTRIVVSHDLALLAGADRLFKLDDGRLTPMDRDGMST